MNLTSWDQLVNRHESKTEICLFHRNDQPLIRVKIQDVIVTSKNSMNVLGVIFDCKLTWSTHIASCISKSRKKLYALRLLKKFFTPEQMRILLDSQFYSVLYYNAVIWLTSNLKTSLSHSLMSLSANALRTCIMKDNYDVSFENIHVRCKKCTPLKSNFIRVHSTCTKL